MDDGLSGSGTALGIMHSCSTFARVSRAGGGQSLQEVEAEQVGAGKDDETEGLGRLGVNLRRRNWRQGLTGASRPDINRERSAT